MTETFRQIGDTRIDLLLDGVFETTRDVLIHQGGQAARRRLIEAWGERPIRVDVNCFLLRGPDGITMVDAGTGTAWGPNLGHARDAMAAAGVTPEAVDRVLVTHIHGDHALGLLEGDAAVLPRAEILVPAADLAFFTDADERAALPESRRGGFDLADKLRVAYGDRLRTISPGAVRPGIEAIALPGHTPGQVGYLVRAATEALLLWGDVLHLAEVQAPDPDAGLVFDHAPDVAAATRRTILERAATEGWMVGGGHITGFGRVERAGDSFRIVTS